MFWIIFVPVNEEMAYSADPVADVPMFVHLSNIGTMSVRIGCPEHVVASVLRK